MGATDLRVKGVLCLHISRKRFKRLDTHQLELKKKKLRFYSLFGTKTKHSYFLIISKSFNIKKLSQNSVPDITSYELKMYEDILISFADAGR